MMMHFLTLSSLQMIARTEGEFNMFNRMDVARREYESRHGVGSGGDGASERRACRSPTADKPLVPRVKRKKENENEDSTDPSTRTSATDK